MPTNPHILRPRDVPGITVRTPDEYRGRQRALLRQNPAAHSKEPWLAIATVQAYVGAGAWRVRCTCGEAPPADPDWRLACCSGCGAIYEGVHFPPADTLAAIEAVLVLRPNQATRNWRPGETLEDLRAENLAHGDPA